MQHSELPEWSLFLPPLPSDEQSAFYTSLVFIWLCFFSRKFWDWLQFIFILITLPGRKNGTNHKISQFSASQWTSCLDLPLKKKREEEEEERKLANGCVHQFDMTGV